jgi:beta-aspartyl-dipeptidase (metallo-type)
MFVLLRGAEVYAPEPLGRMDVLFFGERIATIAERIDLPSSWGEVQVVDLTGKMLVPGFIDQHAHFLGGGGGTGFYSRVPPMPLSFATRAGITTMVGALGMDAVTRSPDALLAVARGLEDEGLTTFIYTGTTQEHPPRTFTGSIRSDIVLIDKVIGAGEIAISELGPSTDSVQASPQTLAKIAVDAYWGGKLTGKAGIVCLHVGYGRRGLQPLFDLLEMTNIPLRTFVAAHVNDYEMYLQQAIKFAKNGGAVDLTSNYTPEMGFERAIKPSDAVQKMLDAGVSVDRVTMSTDGNGAFPVVDANHNPIGPRYLPLQTLYTEWRDIVSRTRLPIEHALTILTSNVARVLRLERRKGQIRQGLDADVLVLEKDLALQQVWARGRLMVDEGKPVVLGTWERLYSNGSEGHS